MFQAGPLTFGIVICHEGWRYPETVRWAARRGAHVVFHPHAHVAEPGSVRPRLQTRRTRFMRRPCCAELLRTPAISRQ
jgi:predicted amidohydrolase